LLTSIASAVILTSTASAAILTLACRSACAAPACCLPRPAAPARFVSPLAPLTSILPGPGPINSNRKRDRRCCDRGKGNAGKTPTPSSLPRPRGLGRRWSAAGSARVSPVLGGGAAPPGPGPRQVSAGTSTESYRPSTFVLGWVSDLASEGFQFVRLAAARMPAAGFCDDGKMCKNT